MTISRKIYTTIHSIDLAARATVVVSTCLTAVGEASTYSACAPPPAAEEGSTGQLRAICAGGRT